MTDADLARTGVRWVVLARDPSEHDGVIATIEGSTGSATHRLASEAVSDWVSAQEQRFAPRWVWSDTATWYGRLLADGVRIARCHDLRLTHAILRDTERLATGLAPSRVWAAVVDTAPASQPALFEVLDDPRERAHGAEETASEWARQRALLDATDGRLRLLVTAESTGALIAAEMRAAGVPWDVPTHERMLAAELGERPLAGGSPALLEAAAERVRVALDAPGLALESQPRLLRALHRAGILVQSTNKWELGEIEHPAIAPLLEYKRLQRLMSANGWAWLDEWVQDGRFHPVYVPGGVVTGRWASSGGGALQLPRQLRTAVRADPGWSLVVADVAQLEPRVLAAMAGDTAMADAARGCDLYSGIVEARIVASRQEAKIAVLGAMYGATSGDAGRLVPRLRRAFPRAMALVDDAARRGEDGGVVSTLLGRTAPPPGDEWTALQRCATESGAGAAEETRARRAARDRGRFTRNFVVQGTAAEWALCWLGGIRARLHALGASDAAESRSGGGFARRAHLAFFLHDEVILHVPSAQAEAAAVAVRDAAAEAARLMFGSFPLDFPLDLRIAQDAAK